MKIKNITESYDHLPKDIRNEIQSIENKLPKESKNALKSFTGYDVIDNEPEGSGYYNISRLEDAYSGNPSKDNLIIKKQLDKYFEPFRRKLKNMFGNKIRLYRFQQMVDGMENQRNTLSWTLDKNYVFKHGGISRINTKILSDDDIKKLADEYNKTGKVQYKRYKFIKDDDEYYDIYIKNEHITDGDDLYDDLKNIQKDEQEILNNNLEKMNQIKTALVPIDAIIWITNRINQSEVIVHNSSKYNIYINNLGELIKNKLDI